MCCKAVLVCTSREYQHVYVGDGYIGHLPDIGPHWSYLSGYMPSYMCSYMFSLTSGLRSR